MFLTVGLVFLPPFSDFVYKKHNFQLRLWHKAFVLVGCFVLLGAFGGPAAEYQAEYPAEDVVDQSGWTDEEKITNGFEEIYEMALKADEAYDNIKEQIDKKDFEAIMLVIPYSVMVMEETVEFYEEYETIDIENQDHSDQFMKAVGDMEFAYIQKKEGVEALRSYMETQETSYVEVAQAKFEVSDSAIYEAMTKFIEILNEYELLGEGGEFTWMAQYY